MASSFSYVPYNETGYFSKLVTDYLGNHPDTSSFYLHPVTSAGIAAAIAERSAHKTDRKMLVETLAAQYASLTQYEKAQENIQLLLDENTFTVCTAHQPNLLTGYLYFIYKIMHAIKLAEDLGKQYPGKRFVPVFYMGSEDNDLEELGTFRFRGEKYVWDGDGQQGAVGRMSTKGLKALLTRLFHMFGPPGKNADELQGMLTAAYLQHGTVAEATQYLVNELFGRFGLVVLNPDDARLKRAFIPVMEDELLHQAAFPIVSAQIEKLGEHYKIQAYPRPINLFYLHDQLRERIEHNEETWEVLNTDIKWNREQLLNELHTHPERFSPNVVLRGLYQETILPDVAFIGGGAEVAYWLQLKTLFAHYMVNFPVILLRQSVLWMADADCTLLLKTGLSIPEIFKKDEELIRHYMVAHTDGQWQTGGEMEAIADIFDQLRQKATAIDPTLGPSAEATLVKMKHQLAAMEKKMLRAEKKKMEIHLDRIRRLKKSLFPNSSLQERIDNFAEYYLEYGPAFFDLIKEGIMPLGNEFLVVQNTKGD